MAYGDNGYRYLKNGDPSGDLCSNCGRELYLQKGVTKWLRQTAGPDIKKKVWELRCYCGYKTEFQKNNKHLSAYK
jgi:hypothetical protein